MSTQQLTSLANQLQKATSGSDSRFNALDTLWDLASSPDVQIAIVQQTPALIVQLVRVLQEERGPERRYALGVLSNLSILVSNRATLSSPSFGLLSILLATVHDFENDTNHEAKLNILTILFNLSSEENVVKELMSLKGHLTYIKVIRECGPDPSLWEELDKDRYLGQQAVDCMMNIARWEFTRDILKGCDTVSVLAPLARSFYDVSFTATVTISFLIGREEKGLSMDIMRPDSLPGQVIGDLLGLSYEKKRTVGGILFSLPAALHIYLELSLSDNKKKLLATSANRQVLQRVISHIVPQSKYAPSAEENNLDALTCDLAMRVLYQLSFVQEEDEALREKVHGFIPDACGLKDMLAFILSRNEEQLPARKHFSDAWRLLAARLDIKLQRTTTAPSTVAPQTTPTIPTQSISTPQTQQTQPAAAVVLPVQQQQQIPQKLTTSEPTRATPTATVVIPAVVERKKEAEKSIAAAVVVNAVAEVEVLPPPKQPTTITPTTPITTQQTIPLPLSTPAVTVNKGDGKHIMISYCWSSPACPEIVRDFAKALKETAGYEVWIDQWGSSYVPKMSGSVDDCMALAIEHSFAVIICVSKEYKVSNNCRLEANYANVRLKNRQLSKIIFVMMQEGYTTVSIPDCVDGYLGMMVGSSLWYPLWHPRMINSTLHEVENLIGDHARQVTTITTAPLTTIQTSNATTTSTVNAAVSVATVTTNTQQQPQQQPQQQIVVGDLSALQSWLEGRLHRMEDLLDGRLTKLETQVTLMGNQLKDIQQQQQLHHKS